MNAGVRWGFVVWLGCLGGLTASCGSDDEERKVFGNHCESDGDCVEGLFCARGGDVRGQCTMACSLDNTGICASRFGDRAFCHVDSVCAMECDEGACNTGLRCDHTGIPSMCIR